MSDFSWVLCLLVSTDAFKMPSAGLTVVPLWVTSTTFLFVVQFCSVVTRCNSFYLSLLKFGEPPEYQGWWVFPILQFSHLFFNFASCLSSNFHKLPQGPCLTVIHDSWSLLMLSISLVCFFIWTAFYHFLCSTYVFQVSLYHVSKLCSLNCTSCWILN